MKTIEDRLDELEFRVRALEHEIQTLRSAQKQTLPTDSPEGFMTGGDFSKEAALAPAAAPVTALPAETAGNPAAFCGGSAEYFPATNKLPEAAHTKKFKASESLVGKYFIGALASLLIFIAAASFIAIVWNKISPAIKLSIVSLTGLLLSALGLRMTLRKASNVSSVLFGTGIGLVYIAAASASLVFSLLPHEASAALGVLWTLMILFSHRYTGLYFTIIIASIGSLINLSLELAYIESSRDIMLVIVYTAIVTLMLLYMSHPLDRIRNALSIFFAFFNFALIFLATFSLWGSRYPLAQTLVTLIMMLLANWMYRLSNRENIRSAYFILTVFSTLFLFFNIALTLSDWTKYAFTGLQTGIIFFIALLLQCIINHILYPNIEHRLTIFYTLPLYLTMLYINDTLLRLRGMGAAAILLLFILRKKIWKKSIPILYMMLFLFLDFLFSYDQHSVWALSFQIANLLLLFYILYEEKTESGLSKNMAVAMLLLGYFKISYDICELTNWNLHVQDIQNFLAYLMSVITVFFIYKIGYLRSKDETQPQLRQHVGLYIFSILLYMFGMQEMLHTGTTLLRFIIMLATLAVALFQSRLLLSDYEEIPNYIGIWLVVKYFLFTWALLRAFSNLPFDSVSYSVSGLLLAVGAIYAGFRRNIKIVRQFGLGITMLMVVKFIFADLRGENSITRVLAFAAGGALCFVISIIYNRLSKE